MQACESLKKLDLTVNFVGEISSIESLKNNEFLEELYLVGNPCANYEGKSNQDFQNKKYDSNLRIKNLKL